MSLPPFEALGLDHLVLRIRDEARMLPTPEIIEARKPLGTMPAAPAGRAATS